MSSRREFMGASAAVAAAAALPLPALAARGPIRIGAALPFSGGLELFGNQAKIGIDLAVAEINAEGGILGSKVEVLYQDNKTDPKTSVEIMSLMRDLCRSRGIPVMVNMHDVDLARRFADRIIGMSGGRVVYDGPPDGLSDEVLTSIYGGKGWLH